MGGPARRTLRRLLLSVCLLVAPGLSAGCTTDWERQSVPTAADPATRPALTRGERALLQRLVAFARAPSAATAARVPFAERVRLGLGRQVLPTLPRSRLQRTQSWWLDPPLFRAYLGPFSALDLLARNRRLRFAAGPHRQCVSPSIAPPRGLERLRRLSLQPRDIESCLQWFAVDLFLTREERIAAVTLDLWEP